LPSRIEIVTEELPPYQFTDFGKVTGVSTQIVRAVLDRLGIEGDFAVLPWPRAVRMAESQPNVLIYSIVRDAARESRFKWAGVVAEGRNYLYCLAGRDIRLTSLDDAKKLVVGTVIGDFREDYLLRQGFVEGLNLDSATSNRLNYAKLKSGRTDLWISDRFAMAYEVRAAGDDPMRTVKPVLEITDPTVNPTAEMAFGLKTEDGVVDAFREALEGLKADGTYAAIVKKWTVEP
jgi:polar amino acid transport system substrate-binding protein